MMRVARILALVACLGSGLALMAHVAEMPGGPSWGWFASGRVSKSVFLQYLDAPTDTTLWSGSLGRSRPETPRPHPVLSEVEITVWHRVRGDAPYVDITITADSEEEVDRMIAALRRDVEAAYAGTLPIPGGGEVPDQKGFLHDDDAHPATRWFWRQRYLALLILNLIVASGAFIALRSASRKC